MSAQRRPALRRNPRLLRLALPPQHRAPQRRGYVGFATAGPPRSFRPRALQCLSRRLERRRRPAGRQSASPHRPLGSGQPRTPRRQARPRGGLLPSRLGHSFRHRALPLGPSSVKARPPLSLGRPLPGSPQHGATPRRQSPRRSRNVRLPKTLSALSGLNSAIANSESAC